MDGFGDELHIGLAHDEQVLARHAQAVGPQLDLVGALLSGGVQHGLVFSERLADLQQDGRLADAGVAGQQDDRAFDDAAAEDPVKLGKAGQVTVFPDGLYFRYFLGHPAGASAEAAGDGRALPLPVRPDFLLHGIPLPALGALAIPFGVFIAAVLADIHGFELRCHSRVLS